MAREQVKDALQAKKKAMQFLEHMDQSEATLRGKLLQKGFEPEDVQEAIAYVKAFHYLDDARYAENYIRSRFTQKPKGKIMMELSQKGISKELANEAWDVVCEYETHDETEMIRKEVNKRCKDGIPTDSYGRAKLYGALYRKGFSYEDIDRVLGGLGQEDF